MTTVLEAFLERIQPLPGHIQRNFNLIRILDEVREKKKQRKQWHRD